MRKASRRNSFRDINRYPIMRFTHGLAVISRHDNQGFRCERQLVQLIQYSPNARVIFAYLSQVAPNLLVVRSDWCAFDRLQELWLWNIRSVRRYVVDEERKTFVAVQLEPLNSIFRDTLGVLGW